MKLSFIFIVMLIAFAVGAILYFRDKRSGKPVPQTIVVPLRNVAVPPIGLLEPA